MQKVFKLLIVVMLFATYGANAKLYVNVEPQIETYIKIASISYNNAYKKAHILYEKVQEFLQEPNNINLQEAKKAWKRARYHYGQTNIFRYYGGPIDYYKNANDKGPEERINSWPIDPAYIDYTHYDKSNGIILNNAIKIDKETLKRKNRELDKTDVTLGFHVIEFLLWGEDIYNDSAGQRPVSDYAPTEQRRRKYLKLATEILVEDLKKVANDWGDGQGAYSQYFRTLPQNEALRKIFKGLTRFTGPEFAGKFLGAPLIGGIQEDEKSNFSDNTHNDFISANKGIQNVWMGQIDDYSGDSLSNLIERISPDLAHLIIQQLITNKKRISDLPHPFDKEILFKESSDYLPVPEEDIIRQSLEATMQSILKTHVFFWQAMVELGIYQWSEKDRLRYEINATLK